MNEGVSHFEKPFVTRINDQCIQPCIPWSLNRVPFSPNEFSEAISVGEGTDAHFPVSRTNGETTKLRRGRHTKIKARQRSSCRPTNMRVINRVVVINVNGPYVPKAPVV